MELFIFIDIIFCDQPTVVAKLHFACLFDSLSAFNRSHW